MLGEPFGIPANFIGIGMNCLVLFFIHQKMKNHNPLPPRSQLTAGGVIMWLQLTKYLFYLSFFLNIAWTCGYSSASSSGSGI